MSELAQRRWRLALGRYASDQLGALGGRDGELDRTLDYLYSREYDSRGVNSRRGPGSLDPTQMKAVKWLGKARSLFPESVFETLQQHALDRYGISDLLNDPKTLESLEPNQDLLKASGRCRPDHQGHRRTPAQRGATRFLRTQEPLSPFERCVGC